MDSDREFEPLYIALRRSKQSHREEFEGFSRVMIWPGSGGSGDQAGRRWHKYGVMHIRAISLKIIIF
jgi:hypothetical protein